MSGYCVVDRVTCAVEEVTVWRRTTSVVGTYWHRLVYASTPAETRKIRKANLSSRKHAKLWSVKYLTLKLIYELFAADSTVKQIRQLPKT